MSNVSPGGSESKAVTIQGIPTNVCCIGDQMMMLICHSHLGDLLEVCVAVNQTEWCPVLPMQPLQK